jgi:phospholipid transport system transporter-binding protein
MNSPQLERVGEDRLLVSGELSMSTVPALLAQSHWQESDRELHVDLQNVERADSAGVALLVEWRRQASRQQRTISFHNIPSQLLAIARLCGVDELLALS